MKYINSHYNGNAIIVFDGYGNGASIKDTTHERHTGGVSQAIHFQGDIVMKSK